MLGVLLWAKRSFPNYVPASGKAFLSIPSGLWSDNTPNHTLLEQQAGCLILEPSTTWPLPLITLKDTVQNIFVQGARPQMALHQSGEARSVATNLTAALQTRKKGAIVLINHVSQSRFHPYSTTVPSS